MPKAKSKAKPKAKAGRKRKIMSNKTDENYMDEVSVNKSISKATRKRNTPDADMQNLMDAVPLLQLHAKPTRTRSQTKPHSTLEKKVIEKAGVGMTNAVSNTVRKSRGRGKGRKENANSNKDVGSESSVHSMSVSATKVTLPGPSTTTQGNGTATSVSVDEGIESQDSNDSSEFQGNKSVTVKPITGTGLLSIKELETILSIRKSSTVQSGNDYLLNIVDTANQCIVVSPEDIDKASNSPASLLINDTIFARDNVLNLYQGADNQFLKIYKILQMTKNKVLERDETLQTTTELLKNKEEECEKLIAERAADRKRFRLEWKDAEQTRLINAVIANTVEQQEFSDYKYASKLEAVKQRYQDAQKAVDVDRKKLSKENERLNRQIDGLRKQLENKDAIIEDLKQNKNSCCSRCKKINSSQLRSIEKAELAFAFPVPIVEEETLKQFGSNFTEIQTMSEESENEESFIDTSPEGENVEQLTDPLMDCETLNEVSLGQGVEDTDKELQQAKFIKPNFESVPILTSVATSNIVKDLPLYYSDNSDEESDSDFETVDSKTNRPQTDVVEFKPNVPLISMPSMPTLDIFVEPENRMLQSPSPMQEDFHPGSLFNAEYTETHLHFATEMEQSFENIELSKVESSNSTSSLENETTSKNLGLINVENSTINYQILSENESSSDSEKLEKPELPKMDSQIYQVPEDEKTSEENPGSPKIEIIDTSLYIIPDNANTPEILELKVEDTTRTLQILPTRESSSENPDLPKMENSNAPIQIVPNSEIASENLKLLTVVENINTALQILPESESQNNTDSLNLSTENQMACTVFDTASFFNSENNLDEPDPGSNSITFIFNNDVQTDSTIENLQSHVENHGMYSDLNEDLNLSEDSDSDPEADGEEPPQSKNLVTVSDLNEDLNLSDDSDLEADGENTTDSSTDSDFHHSRRAVTTTDSESDVGAFSDNTFKSKYPEGHKDALEIAEELVNANANKNNIIQQVSTTPNSGIITTHSQNQHKSPYKYPIAKCAKTVGSVDVKKTYASPFGVPARFLPKTPGNNQKQSPLPIRQLILSRIARTQPSNESRRTKLAKIETFQPQCVMSGKNLCQKQLIQNRQQMWSSERIKEKCQVLKQAEEKPSTDLKKPLLLDKTRRSSISPSSSSASSTSTAEIPIQRGDRSKMSTPISSLHTPSQFQRQQNRKPVPTNPSKSMITVGHNAQVVAIQTKANEESASPMSASAIIATTSQSHRPHNGKRVARTRSISTNPNPDTAIKASFSSEVSRIKTEPKKELKSSPFSTLRSQVQRQPNAKSVLPVKKPRISYKRKMDFDGSIEFESPLSPPPPAPSNSNFEQSQPQSTYTSSAPSFLERPKRIISKNDWKKIEQWELDAAKSFLSKILILDLLGESYVPLEELYVKQEGSLSSLSGKGQMALAKAIYLHVLESEENDNLYDRRMEEINIIIQTLKKLTVSTEFDFKNIAGLTYEYFLTEIIQESVCFENDVIEVEKRLGLFYGSLIKEFDIKNGTTELLWNAMCWCPPYIFGLVKGLLRVNSEDFCHERTTLKKKAIIYFIVNPPNYRDSVCRRSAESLVCQSLELFKKPAPQYEDFILSLIEEMKGLEIDALLEDASEALGGLLAHWGQITGVKFLEKQLPLLTDDPTVSDGVLAALCGSVGYMIEYINDPPVTKQTDTIVRNLLINVINKSKKSTNSGSVIDRDAAVVHAAIQKSFKRVVNGLISRGTAIEFPYCKMKQFQLKPQGKNNQSGQNKSKIPLMSNNIAKKKNKNKKKRKFKGKPNFQKMNKS